MFSPVCGVVYRRTQDAVLWNCVSLGIPYVSRLVLRKNTLRGIANGVVFALIKRVVVDVRNAASRNLCFFPLAISWVESYESCPPASRLHASESIETRRRRLPDGFPEVNGKQRVRDVMSMRVPSHQDAHKTDYRLTSSQENTLLERCQCMSRVVRLADMSRFTPFLRMSTQSQKYVRQPCQEYP